jgi:REP element-mobilizing transposase RayT
MLDRHARVVQALCEHWQVEFLERNGQVDRVHRLLGLSPKCAHGIVANHLKTVTSQRLRK